jgi:hypothetical protein
MVVVQSESINIATAAKYTAMSTCQPPPPDRLLLVRAPPATGSRPFGETCQSGRRLHPLRRVGGVWEARWVSIMSP